MKITKVENISSMILDFFLKQNNIDIRVALKPGEASWCDSGSSTKSMILYERKDLIKTSVEAEQNFFPPIDPEDLKNIKPVTIEEIKENIKKAIEEIPKVNNVSSETLASSIIPTTPLAAPTGQLFHIEPIHSDNPPTEIIKKEAEEPAKTYKGKKRGRKKKRGPKPGSKRKK